MTLTELTTASAWILGLAIVATIAAGWRKPARATVPVARGRRTSRPAVGVREVPTDTYHGTTVLRRLWAVVAGSTLSLISGAVLAIMISIGLAWSVITLTNKLGR